MEIFDSSPSTAKNPTQTSTEMQEHRGVVGVYETLHLLLLLLHKTKVLCKVRCSVGTGIISSLSAFSESNSEKEELYSSSGNIDQETAEPLTDLVVQRETRELKYCFWKAHSCKCTTPCHKELLVQRNPPGPGQADQSVPGYLKGSNFCSPLEFP